VIPVSVALSRMYRGMHHPLDVAGGLIIGIGALLVLLFACRAAGVAHEARSSRTAKSAPLRRAEPVA
jgi:membrane-associated phospholipid phosphatase